MPKATTSMHDTERFALKSCPPDGYVVLRRLTYGEYLERRQMTSGMKVHAGQGKDFEGLLDLMNRKTTEYEFKNCIIEHNLTDEAERQLDFKRRETLSRLDPRVGEEIATYIARMNQFEEDSDEDGNPTSADSETEPEPVSS